MTTRRRPGRLGGGWLCRGGWLWGGWLGLWRLRDRSDDLGRRRGCGRHRGALDRRAEVRLAAFGGDHRLVQPAGGRPVRRVLRERAGDEAAQRFGEFAELGLAGQDRDRGRRRRVGANGWWPVAAYATTAPQAKTSAAAVTAAGPRRCRTAPAPCTRPCRPSGRCGVCGWSPRARGRSRSRSPSARPSANSTLRRLEIAVDDAGAVDRGQRGRDPDRDAVQVARGSAARASRPPRPGSGRRRTRRPGRASRGRGRRRAPRPCRTAAPVGPALTSLRKRPRNSSSSACSARMTLTATWRPSASSAQEDRAHAALAEPPEQAVSAHLPRVGGPQRRTDGSGIGGHGTFQPASENSP